MRVIYATLAAFYRPNSEVVNAEGIPDDGHTYSRLRGVRGKPSD